ncbi:purine-nucleoside phosphorylase [Acidiferrimicrobium sp. IK]|uniref:purine-nucleoside phosphorylase n=1 Tax=Acidiferrimicrobium sp. IK TaxID=2871700 RepID=UPI0021CB542A|nr:purine-nucleoside phosphorylase [Acidiferrimicrobium sp. IK]MCU4185831.1 purine-nucleoside phosphorylase [Acidiferrimicrobium sp. IK]
MTGADDNFDPYEHAEEAAATLAARSGVAAHDVAVILGSGWAPAADALGPPSMEMAMADLGGRAASVAGHSGTVRSVARGEGRALVFVGRVHAYEGHPLHAVVHAVRTALAAGCRTVVLTNAAGGINPTYRVGQAVLISDHLNLTGRSPLSGPAPPEPHGPRFVDLTDLYSASLRAQVAVAAASRGLPPGGPATLAEGVYAGLPGPHYETPAEIRMLRTLGADLVGMSTVHEAIAARHGGAAVLGISLVTNAAAGVTGEALDHAEVVAAGTAATADLGRLLAVAVDVAAAR